MEHTKDEEDTSQDVLVIHLKLTVACLKVGATGVASSN